tara:strand:+ start:2670 stop:2891 length:222 start_codon:yes stop_codon:yes gene_type:complete
MRPVPEFTNVNFKEFELELISRARPRALLLASKIQEFSGVSLGGVDELAVELAEFLAMEMLTMDQTFVIQGHL